MKILDARELTARFKGRGGPFGGHGDDVRALDSVSFSLDAGESLAVIGESGSGKTTLLRAILGLIPVSSGSVELFGGNIAAMSGDERLAARRRCGYVLQDPYSSLPPTLSVRDAVMEPWSVVHGRARGSADSRAEALLAEMKLPEDLWNVRVRYSLSGGQRQRVAVARALMLGPELLLCDEPTAMQDVSTRQEVLGVLERRVADGMAMIMVTHDLLLAHRAAKRGIVLHKGVIVDAGDTAELLRNPSHNYTKSLLAALPRI
ncbi:MAG: ATP-binding cassette domain-containing protein [Synergistaceae bacterium]|jgi:peptide/nickel transport system ATP-binding protein|nr:ATP-binding cassette domain-containing protein [Synergistaceae bacterium]